MGLHITPEQLADLERKGLIAATSAVRLPDAAPTTDAPAANKYGNQVCEVDGLRFDSKKEARRWLELRAMEQAGVIADLTRQEVFRFVVNEVYIGRFTADFVYVELPIRQRVVEDCKSEATRKIRDYPLRKKLMRACYGIEIREV